MRFSLWLASLFLSTAALAQAPPVTPEPTSAAPPRRLRVAEGVASGMAVHKVPPKYPDAARSAGVQGSVVLSLVVGVSGDVEQVATVSGDPALAEAATEAVKQWKYQPYTVDGSPVQMETQITVGFHLQAKPHPPSPPLGRFWNETYENEYFGIRYPLSRDWVRETELVRKKSLPESPQQISYVLLGAVHVPLGSDVAEADSSFVLLALDRAAMAGEGSCRQHLEAFAASLHASKEADLKGEITQFSASGLTFDRANLDFRHAVGPGHQTFVCTAVKDFLLQWNILGSSKSAIETVLATLQGINGPAPPDPTPPQVPDRVRVSSGVSTGLLLKKITPRYPQAARYAHIQGSVVMKAVINKLGDVIDLEVIEGPIDLVPSAVSAVRQWKYKPYLLMGKPIDVVTQVTVIYALSG